LHTHMSIHNPELGAVGPSLEKDQEQKERLQEKKKASALADIIESGRAATPEAAEQYLERLNTLKRHVLEFLRDMVIEKRERALTPVQSHDYYSVAYLPDTFDKTNRKSVDNETIKGWHNEDIDMTDPHIWTLLHESDSTTDETRPSEEIRIGTTTNAAISIPEQMSGMAGSLRKYLSADELALLNAEHEYERKALVRRLREQADEYEQMGPRYDFPGWQSLSEETK